MTNPTLDDDGLITGQSAALPAVICLDVSYSMAGQKIDDLNKSLRLFLADVRDDRKAKRSVEWEFVTFGAEIVRQLGHFQRASEPIDLEEFVANNGTPLAEAVNVALDLLDAKKTEYQQDKRSYYQPWLVIMTDGAASSSQPDLDAMVARLNDRLEKDKLVVIAVGVGHDWNQAFLSKLSPKRKPDHISDTDIKSYFKFLSGEFIKASKSAPGVEIQPGQFPEKS
jgi:uncharacterized protein YegL